MVRTRGGSRVRPRVRFSTPEREAAAPVPAPVPEPEVVASTQAAQHAAHDQRLARAEATLGQCHSMLHQIMTHLGLPHDPAPRQEPATDDDADSLDVLAAAAAASHPSPPQQ